ncbi:hypothetical protein SAMD00023353_0303170 [Rosellinia necatrix]|uniref:Uncharacterized protein n=1 Tax=Rosellinia necatrix TaxID=77044 RepID=A0A1W2TDW6_ROSNE|nr:hypothetical protein SAMD00023353_0303170 [Rosellinia necatrix]
MRPGLTLNTEAAASKASRQQSPAHRAAASVLDSGNPPTRPFQSTTPIPVPIPMPYAPREPRQASPRSSSPTRPTYSPITPPSNAAAFPPRPTYTHGSHADATAAPAPPPEPIDFNSNPDVLALKSAISILQMQRRKAVRDMATLDHVKDAALAEPEAFVRDLTTGRVRVEGDRLFGGGGGGGGGGEKGEDEDGDGDSGSDSGSSSGTDHDSEGDNPDHSCSRGTKYAGTDPQPVTDQRPASQIDLDINVPGTPPWRSIPKPQNIVRCPPINWSQYAIVGESLDKLHKEQVQRPAQGTPAVLTLEGRFEFKGGDGRGVGKQERYLGVAAPYAPGKDRIDAKPKIPPRR